MLSTSEQERDSFQHNKLPQNGHQMNKKIVFANIRLAKFSEMR